MSEPFLQLALPCHVMLQVLATGQTGDDEQRKARREVCHVQG